MVWIKKNLSDRKYVDGCYKIGFEVTLISVFHIHSKKKKGSGKTQIYLEMLGILYYVPTMKLDWLQILFSAWVSKTGQVCFLTDDIWIVNTMYLKDKTCRLFIKHMDETNFFSTMKHQMKDPFFSYYHATFFWPKKSNLLILLHRTKINPSQLSFFCRYVTW